ncbi:unnamed protein product [Candida parapsilosis]
MIRSSIRKVHHASKEIPYQAVPRGKYNPKRSAFNFKPKPIDGLVHNPPAAIINPSMQTPYIFLPPNDPRRELAKQYRLSEDVVADMPVIRAFKAPHEREYTVTKEVVDQIKQLRNEDPERWNLKELSKKFDIELSKLVYFLRSDLPKSNKPEDKASVPMRRNQNNDRPRTEGPKREAILDLNKYKNEEIRVRFVGGRQVTGVLKGYDQLMNLVLEDVKEQFRDPENEGKYLDKTRDLGLVVVRCTSLLTISPVKGSEIIDNPFVSEQ